MARGVRSSPSSSMAPWRFSFGPYFSVAFFCSFATERAWRSSLLPPIPNRSSNPI